MPRRNHTNQFNPKLLTPDYKENFNANERGARELAERIEELRRKYPGMHFSFSPPRQIVGYDLKKQEELRRQVEKMRHGEIGIEYVG